MSSGPSSPIFNSATDVPALFEDAHSVDNANSTETSHADKAVAKSTISGPDSSEEQVKDSGDLHDDSTNAPMQKASEIPCSAAET